MPVPTPYAAHILEAHGVLACVSWAVLAPLGAIAIRLVPSKKAWIIHGGIMLFVLALLTASFGMGLARVMAVGSHIGKTAHFILGTILFAMAWLQPFLGTAHHFVLKATGKRTLLSAFHVFFGRIFMLAGVINGGVGLLLRGNSTRAENIAYGTVVGIVWVTYVLVSLQMELNRQQGSANEVKERSSISSESTEGVEVGVERKA